jgi:hypothetical protein
MFKENLICSLKVDGKILREDEEGNVYIPFGSEFSLYFKNQESRDVSVKVEIDGTDVLDGDELCIRANSILNLERFIKNGDMTQGRRFRFIKKTEEISDFRGDKVDDGFIRVEYTFEKKKPEITHSYHHEHVYCKCIQPCRCRSRRRRDIYPSGIFRDDRVRENLNYSMDSITLGASSAQAKGVTRGAIPKSINMATSASVGDVYSGSSADGGATCQSFDSFDSAEIQSDEGITVAGSKSDQTFQNVTMGELEANSHTMILHLKGESKKKAKMITKPILVKTKIQCSSCGQKWSSINEYCGRCGTSLKD